MLNMEQGTKITTASKQTSANSNPLLGDKDREQYKIDSKKALVRSFKNGAWVAAAKAFLILISWNFSNIENIFYFSFITAFVSFVILQSKIQTKYKIPRTNHCTDNQFNYDSYNRSRRHFDDLNPGIIGSAAWWADKHTH